VTPSNNPWVDPNPKSPKVVGAVYLDSLQSQTSNKKQQAQGLIFMGNQQGRKSSGKNGSKLGGAKMNLVNK
jgi:hypothetical protein